MARLPEPRKLAGWLEERAVMAAHIKELSRGTGALNILEAGCGNNWGLDLKGVPYVLTGVDLDQHALDVRPTVMGPAIQAIQEYEQETGYSWQQRGPLGVACAS